MVSYSSASDNTTSGNTAFKTYSEVRLMSFWIIRCGALLRTDVSENISPPSSYLVAKIWTSPSSPPVEGYILTTG
jgi:hypothetical protein